MLISGLALDQLGTYYQHKHTSDKSRHYFCNKEWSGTYPKGVVSLDQNFMIMNIEDWTTGDAECRKYIKNIATDAGLHCGEIKQLYVQCNRRSFLRACREQREYISGWQPFYSPTLTLDGLYCTMDNVTYYALH